MNRNADHLQGGEDNSRADAVLAGGHLQAPEQVPGHQQQVSASFALSAGAASLLRKCSVTRAGAASPRQVQRHFEQVQRHFGWAGRLSGGRLLLRPRAHRASRRGGRLLRGVASQQLPDWFSLSGR